MNESFCEMPSLMLKPAEEDKSTIKCYFPGLFFLGITPRGLM